METRTEDNLRKNIQVCSGLSAGITFLITFIWSMVELPRNGWFTNMLWSPMAMIEFSMMFHIGIVVWFAWRFKQFSP